MKDEKVVPINDEVKDEQSSPVFMGDRAFVDAAERLSLDQQHLLLMLLEEPTQEHIADAFEMLYGGGVIYCVDGRAGWYLWTGTHWKCDNRNTVAQLIRCITRQARPRNQSKGHTTANFNHGVVALLKASPQLVRSTHELDTDRFKLNTPAGVFHLKTGVFTPHEQTSEIHTKITGVAPTPDGEGVRFERFMREITCEDDELYQMIRLGLGAALSGGLEEHIMLFMVGTGRNGKSTLLELIKYVLGSYAKVMPSSLLINLFNGNKHPTDAAGLLGVRLAVCSEIPEGVYWDENTIKSLTGDETISARFMRQDFFEIPRTWRIVVGANHAPQVRNADIAFKSRLKMMPFKASFAGREDRTLPEDLRREAGYVLHWLIVAHLEWVARGHDSGTAKSVEAVSEDYFDNQGTAHAWFADHCEVIAVDDRAGRDWPDATRLYNGYKYWKQSRGEQPISATRFGSEIAAINGVTRIKSGVVRYQGVKMTVVLPV